MGFEQPYPKKIILNAPTSLLIVRANHPRASTGEDLSETRPYRRVLVPFDGSQRAENVFPIVTQLALYLQSQVNLVQFF